MARDVLSILLYITGVISLFYLLGIMGGAQGFVNRLGTGILLMLILFVIFLFAYALYGGITMAYEAIAFDIKSWYRCSVRRCDEKRRGK